MPIIQEFTEDNGKAYHRLVAKDDKGEVIDKSPWAHYQYPSYLKEFGKVSLTDYYGAEGVHDLGDAMEYLAPQEDMFTVDPESTIDEPVEKQTYPS